MKQKATNKFGNIGLILCLCFIAWTATADSQVFQLNDQNIDEVIATNKYVMVKFYAPWCGHCKSMAEDYIKLAELASDNGIVIGELQATENKQAAQKYGVEGYPTIKFFIDGNPISYSGARTTNQMYGWIKKVSEKKLQSVSEEEIKSMVGTKNFVVYMGKNESRIKEVEKLNLVEESVSYYINQDSDQDNLYLYKQNPGEGQEEKMGFSYAFDFETIKQWVISQTLPTVIPLSNKEYLDWVFYDMETMRDVVMLLREEDLSQQDFSNFERLCKQNHNSYKCCFIDRSMEVYSGVCNYLRCDGEKSVLALVRDSLKEAYRYPEEIGAVTTQSFENFGREVNDKKHKNLAEIEEKKVEYEHVVSLSDSNFKSYIEENQLTFVEFYSPGCQHCIEFAPLYDTFAKEVKEVSDQLGGLKLAAIDLQSNPLTAQSTGVTGFPSFRLYVEGEEIPYEGPRAKESILNFIENAKSSLPIEVGSIAEVPTPAVVIYDSAEKSALQRLSALFTRIPVYRIKEGTDEGSSIKVLLRLEDESHTYPSPQESNPEIGLQAVSKWLHKLTDPVLVNLLNPNMDSKLVDALQNKVSIIAFVDVDASVSENTLNLLQSFCKGSSFVCGYAKKTEEHFSDFSGWLGFKDLEDISSELLFIDTNSFDKYRYGQSIGSVDEANLAEWVERVKAGEVEKWTGEPSQESKSDPEAQEDPKQQNDQQQEQKETEEGRQPEEEPKSSEQSEESKSSEQSSDRPSNEQL